MWIFVVQLVLTLAVFIFDAILPEESSVKKSLMPLLGATFILTVVVFLLLS